MSQPQHSAQSANAPAADATLFAPWLEAHPAQIYLMATTDYASGSLMALETFPAASMPGVLSTAINAAGSATWQAIGPNCLQRVGFEPVVPANVLQLDTILALRDLLGARAALNQEQQAVERKIDELFAMLLVKLPP